MKLSQKQLDEIEQHMCRPEGTFIYELSLPEAFALDSPAQIIFNVFSDGHYFQLERTSNKRLNFYHSSLSLGTRCASLDLSTALPLETVRLAVSWSLQDVGLVCVPLRPRARGLTATGTSSSVQFRVASDGTVFRIDNAHAEVLALRAHRGKLASLVPTAKETWTNTLFAVDVLWTGKSDHNFVFEMLQAASTLSMLVTGLESYGRARLLEIEREGIPANAAELYRLFTSKAVQQSAQLADLVELAESKKTSLLSEVSSELRINFQSIDQFKKAFRGAYGIKMNEIGIDGKVIESIRKYIGYRHRMTHVSPLLGILNLEDASTSKPIIANRALADEAIACFRQLVDAIHRATISLKPIA